MRFLPITLTGCMLAACLVIAAPLSCASSSKQISGAHTIPNTGDVQHSLVQHRELVESLFPHVGMGACPKIVQRSFFSAAKHAVKKVIPSSVRHFASKPNIPQIGSIVWGNPKDTTQPILHGPNGKPKPGAEQGHPMVVIGHSPNGNLQVAPISNTPPQPNAKVGSILQDRAHGNIPNLQGNIYTGPATAAAGGGRVEVHPNNVIPDKSNRQVNQKGITELNKHVPP
ncbi:hypothetical protein CPC08DRAFT_820256 [Agrocybe pediades]|nr:hypothetical protein CPC08DRAFT_820256 [Agrocybe pediades]